VKKIADNQKQTSTAMAESKNYGKLRRGDLNVKKKEH